MTDIIRAWKKDSDGDFIEMDVGEIKPYGIDYTNFLAEIVGDTLAQSVWTIGAGLTKNSENVSGKVAIVNLEAIGAGTFACSHKMTSGQGVIEITNFRVIVK